ncbi:MAG: vWA domain-containing protein [Myxococcota bacterium]
MASRYPHRRSFCRAHGTRRPVRLAGRWSPLFALLLALVFAMGCGSKTGLDAPDAESDAMTDADAEITIPCVELPGPNADPIELPLDTEAQLASADVVFLIDVTASMQDEIDRIRDQLRDRLAPAIEGAIPDAQFAVASFADFPVDPFGAQEDSPFELLLPMSSDLSRVQAAVDSLNLGNGRDEPESQVEALYQIATGEGLGTDDDPIIPPLLGCPAGGSGYPCFRDEALPVILLFTDAPFHNGPEGRNGYPSGRIVPAPHTYEQARVALNELEVRVIGFDSGDGEAERDLRQLAIDTGAFSTDGSPLVSDIGRRGERLGTQVVDTIRRFAEGVVFDVDLVLNDPMPGDGVDVTSFVEEVVPLRAVPADGVESIDVEAGIFRGVRSGTRVVFQLSLRNDILTPGPEPQEFFLEVIFRGDGRTQLARRLVRLVIPGEDGAGCGALLTGP